MKETPITLDKENLQKIFRFAFEEEHRRNLSKAKKEALTDAETAAYVYPDYEKYLE